MRFVPAPGPTSRTPSIENVHPMKSVSDVSDLRRLVSTARGQGRSIGFVPTMGALHEGHASLVDRCRADGRFTVVSIFVNPLQFNDKRDLDGYPITTSSDDELCRTHGVDLIFRPDVATIYPAGFDTRVVPGRLASTFEGRHREGHFDGVATVVLKLFNMVAPDVAYFGCKDYQQLAVVRQMVRDFDLPIAVVGCPTIREMDGLALSSRNVKLSADARAIAPVLHRALSVTAEALRSGARTAAARSAGLDILRDVSGLSLDYFEIADRDSLAPVTVEYPDRAVVLVAASIGGVRLIDNLEIEGPGK